MVEIAKYGLGKKDMAANLNLFSKVSVDENGKLNFDSNAQKTGAQITLRFEMDTLVVFHTCPHPMNPAPSYPRKAVQYELFQAELVSDQDICKHHCPENQRGFENNRIYHMAPAT